MNVLDGLNEAQSQAVLNTEGPLLMLAGAGSGKTKTLTHRIAYLISHKRIAPSDILAVTFTNKAAGEMRERISQLLGRDSASRAFVFMGTFHSICVKILRQDCAELGYPANFLIYDAADSQAVIKDVLKKLQIDEKIYSPRTIGGLISSAKNELIEPSDYANMAYGTVQKMAAIVYPAYQAQLKKAAAMDFDDLISQTVKLLRSNKKILEKYQNKFKYILVDEYQDTNTAQYELVHLLAAKHKNICVVGDDWQSIYSWRGANYRNILNFERDYPNATVIRLEQNYRSTQNILDAAHNVITKNTSRSDKKLWTDAKRGHKISVELVNNEMSEAHFIIKTIEQLIYENPKLSLNDFAVLYRVNAQSRSLEEAFLRHNLAYRIVGGIRFYARREIKDALSYLRFIACPTDTVSLVRIINLPPRGLGDKSISAVNNYAEKNEISIFDAIKQAEQIKGLRTAAVKKLQEFAEVIEYCRKNLNTQTPSQTLELILKRSGYLEWLDEGNIISAERVENIKELISVAKNYDSVSLDDFLAEIALLADIDNTAFDKEAVTLMTVHSAKGLEFNAVFIVGMEEGLFPHSNSLFDTEQLEEERRLCYVGMTRAKQHLFLLHASSRLIYGGLQHNPQSRFLMDIPSELTQSRVGLGSASFEHQLQSSEPNIELVAGDTIKHDVFGQGIVIQIDGDEVEVAFSGIGKKKLNLTFAPIVKI